MTLEDKNIQELLEFENNNLSSMTRRTNGNRAFTALVEFKWNGMSEQETLSGTIHKVGYDQGKITFEDGNVINSDVHYNEHIAKFNTWKYLKNSNTLTIEGNSPKVGRYKVSITI